MPAKSVVLEFCMPCLLLECMLKAGVICQALRMV